jgi:hypothetical protein
MAFNDLQQKAASEYAVFAAHKNLAKLSLFSHTFTELEGRPGESVAVPVYDLSAGGDFVAGTNDYGTGVNEVGGLLVELDKHYVKSVSITDKELAYTGINWVKDTSAALAERITRDINAYTFGLINATNVTASAAISTYLGATPSLADFSGLYALAENSDIPVDRCVVVLNPTYFSKVLPLVTYNMVGKEDYIETGVIRGLIGFKGVVCSSNLPEGTVGAILLDEAMGLASKYLAPMTPGAYPEAWSATSDEGFTIGFRRFMDLNTGSDKFAVDCLYGAKLLQANKVVRLTA